MRSVASGVLSAGVDVRTRGTALMLMGQITDAVMLFDGTTRTQQTSADDWSDLAAAEIEQAQRENDPHGLVVALAATDRALELDPKSDSARFNRALVLTLLEIRPLAAEAWRHYLRGDTTTGWAAEARERLRHLEAAASMAEDWKAALPTLRTAALRGDQVALTALVARHRQQSRTWAEGIFLSEWGRLTVEGSEQAADELTIADRVGQTLARASGEMLVADSVRAIRDSKPRERALLAEAHGSYFRGRRALSERRASEAASLLARAAILFEEGGSPMEVLARYFEANAIADGNDFDLAAQRLAELQRRTPSRYRALVAQFAWLEATIAANAGRLDDALRASQRAGDAFAELGERDNENDMATARSTLLALSGREQDAWRARQRVLTNIAASGDSRSLQLVIHSAARQEMAEKHWAAARSLLRLVIDAPGTRNARLRFDAFLRRALAAFRNGGDSQRDFRDAAIELAMIDDSGLRAAASDDLRFVQAVVAAADEPRRGAAMLKECVDFAIAHQRTAHLPATLLERARALRSIDETKAIEDLYEALRLMEGRREGAKDSDIRGSLFKTSSDAFELLLDMQSRRGEDAAALEVLERSRARAILDRLHTTTAIAQPLTASEILARIPPDTTVLEYASLPDRLLLFEMSRQGLHVHSLPITRRELSAAIDRLHEDLTEGKVTPAARELNDWLLRPAASRSAARVVVIVPDETTARVPFAALRDGAHFAVEKTSFVHAPSASVFLHRLPDSGHRLSAAVLVFDPDIDPQRFPSVDALPFARVEAETISRVYPVSTFLTGENARPDVVARRVASADVLHIATHGIIERRDPSLSALLLTPSSTSTGGLWSVREIARTTLPRHMTVVLAGCSTAVSGERGGDVSSLALAFAAAGARNVVGSLWDVEDSAAADFSTRFHGAVSRGVAPADALRDAQLDMLRSSDAKLRNVRSWAAFQLLGPGN